MAATSTTTNGRAGRTASSKAIVVLKLSPDLLSRFPNPSTPVKANTNSNSTTTSSPVKEKEGSPASSSVADPPVPPSDNASDAASTPAGAASAETPRRKGLPGPKPGSKRGHNQGDSVPKPRGKPGPKKKQKMYVLPPPLFFFFYVYLCMMCTNCRQGGWSFRTCQNSHQCRRWSQTRSQGQHRCHQRRTSCPRPHRCSLPQVGAQDAPIEEFHRGPVAAAQLAEP